MARSRIFRCFPLPSQASSNHRLTAILISLLMSPHAKILRTDFITSGLMFVSYPELGNAS